MVQISLNIKPIKDVAITEFSEKEMEKMEEDAKEQRKKVMAEYEKQKRDAKKKYLEEQDKLESQKGESKAEGK